ncbi:DUF3016 domain-containing protein [Wenzhouxiangella sp. AB-CW3]|uniref:DUF3016 domain-containing protein n=1 Tax=Wenzhouxiangella sp. AB-CW3 TaxID=2771012 RepID=UPI00168A82B6|nr:DUF3016 domain-containing protein [Wenzhouxiangella sp. AB-CW3]QOC22435.1 DUF3016 domain-containing protein [Wenzhouxiangella sp. AB-CW3]
MLIRNLTLLSLLLPCLLLATSVAAESDERVEVAFAETDRYTDAGNRPRDHERNLDRLESFLVEAVESCLPEGERVAIQVLDVDLAGRYEWWHHPDGVRVMRDVDFPRLKIEYTHYGSDGDMIDEQQHWIRDMNYLRQGARRSDWDALSHERRMIRRWADEQFCRRTDR